MTTNLVEAVLDRKKLKWDAFWHLFAWLIDEKEGHGLGSSVMEGLCIHAFKQHFCAPKINAEYQLSHVKNGKGKWPDLVVAIQSLEGYSHIIVMDDIDSRSPGNMRKINNLIEYRNLAREFFSPATVHTVVLTNAHDKSTMSKLSESLAEEAADFTTNPTWSLLPMCTVGTWVETSLKSPKSTSDEKTRLFLADFVQWSRSLHVCPNLTSAS